MKIMGSSNLTRGPVGVDSDSTSELTQMQHEARKMKNRGGRATVPRSSLHVRTRKGERSVKV